MSELESTSAQDTGSEDTAPRNRVTKSPEAFRTISEAANELGLPQHVLRFWESKFPQVKPLKRGGGRRYYRPEDIALLTRIRDWLHVEGYTIKGVQKLLRDPASRNGDVENGSSAPAVGDTGNDTPAEPSIAAVPAASVETRQGIDKAIERLTAIQRDLIKAIGD